MKNKPLEDFTLKKCGEKEFLYLVARINIRSKSCQLLLPFVNLVSFSISLMLHCRLHILDKSMKKRLKGLVQTSIFDLP